MSRVLDFHADRYIQFEAAKKTLAFSKMRGTAPKGPVAVTRSEKKWERSRQRLVQRAEKTGAEPFYRGRESAVVESRNRP